MSYPTPPGGPGSASNPYGPYGHYPPPQDLAYQPNVPPASGTWPAGAPGPLPPTTKGRTVRRVFGSLLTLAGVLGLVVGGTLADRAYSNSQRRIVNSAYGPVLWRDEPADRLFPSHLGRAEIGDSDVTKPANANWHRLGISPATSCDEGLKGTVLKEAKRLGCKAVLRATYMDPTGNEVATVALVVLPEARVEAKEKLEQFFADQEGRAGAVNPLAVPGTLAADWKADKRNGAGLVQTAGLPYVVAATVGAADGRVSGDMPDADDLDILLDRESWHGVAGNVADLLRAHIDQLQRAGIRE